MVVLLIGQPEYQRIRDIIADAKAHPVTLDRVRKGAAPDTGVLKLEDRKPGFTRPPSQHMIFPGGYRAAFSFEEQPVGLCTHLSISVIRKEKGKMPSPEAVAMIAEAFNVPYPPDHMWLEEFDRGEHAVNLVSLYRPKS